MKSAIRSKSRHQSNLKINIHLNGEVDKFLKTSLSHKLLPFIFTIILSFTTILYIIGNSLDISSSQIINSSETSDSETNQKLTYTHLANVNFSTSYSVTGSIRLYHNILKPQTKANIKGSNLLQTQTQVDSVEDHIFIMGHLKRLRLAPNDRHKYLLVRSRKNSCDHWSEIVVDLTNDMIFMAGDNSQYGINVVRTKNRKIERNWEHKLDVGNLFVILYENLQVACGVLERFRVGEELTKEGFVRTKIVTDHL
ncbi:hypothetical protein G9A89_001884 [Geosiphon pyriformis]|nr:hypothetical protein G9A89_001884 [Geosiphon pyriformis]